MLSKSKVIRGLQCPKSLWLYTHNYDLQDEIDASQQAIFDTGQDIGLLAQQMWPGGKDATEGHAYPNILCAKETQRLLNDGQEIIYEATFVHDDTLVAVDILSYEEGVWNAYEVKSSTSVKEVNYTDAAVQFYVMQGAGMEIQDISIVHINTDYVRQGDLNLEEFFIKENITEDILDLQEDLPATIKELHALIQGKMPKIEIGGHCADPYSCSFMGHCWKHVPDYSVFNIARIGAKAWDLYDQGVLAPKDVPDDFPLSNNQRLQIESEKNGTQIIDKEGLADFVSDLKYPLYYLDYETINPAIPLFDGQKPYRQMPFQYSLHIQKKSGEIKHCEYLAPTNGSDPREEFIEKLIADCGKRGDILVYNIAFERSKTQDLMDAFPKYRVPLSKIISRMKDLMQPFQQKMYYTPGMRGRYSIKTVLPALVADLSYDDLEIGDGGTASATYLSHFVHHKKLPKDIKQQLIDYCKMDTWAMVKLLEVLKDIK